jgi:ATP-binding cassette subfamily F protein 3
MNDLLNFKCGGRLSLHLGRQSLYSGGYGDSFERQRNRTSGTIGGSQASQDASGRLRDYVARNSARASAAKQAQSRARCS